MIASGVGNVDVQHLCKLAGVSRASYYRRFEAHAPRQADVELTSHIQLLSLRHRFYGYRRITAVLRRSGLVVNAKRVQRLMREDNLIALRRKPFAPATSDSRHGFLIVPGGFNRSSQQPEDGGCHDSIRARFGSMHESEAAFARAPACLAS
jgi:hypothetical protein